LAKAALPDDAQGQIVFLWSPHPGPLPAAGRAGASHDQRWHRGRGGIVDEVYCESPGPELNPFRGIAIVTPAAYVNREP